jgi:hypothetical protein
MWKFFLRLFGVKPEPKAARAEANAQIDKEARAAQKTIARVKREEAKAEKVAKLAKNRTDRENARVEREKVKAAREAAKSAKAKDRRLAQSAKEKEQAVKQAARDARRKAK